MSTWREREREQEQEQEQASELGWPGGGRWKGESRGRIRVCLYWCMSW